MAGTAALLATHGAGAQRLRGDRPERGFTFAVVPSFSLSFGGIRAKEKDTLVCVSYADQVCINHMVGKTPMLGVDVQAPIGRYLGVSVGGAVGRPSQVTCIKGYECGEGEQLTTFKLDGMMLFRYKPQAPLYIGAGYALSHFSPGPVVQQQALTEYGPVFEIAFDVALTRAIGTRLAWRHYWMRTNHPEQLLPNYIASHTAHDALLSLGARVTLGGQ